MHRWRFSTEALAAKSLFFTPFVRVFLSSEGFPSDRVGISISHRRSTLRLLVGTFHSEPAQCGQLAVLDRHAGITGEDFQGVRFSIILNLRVFTAWPSGLAHTWNSIPRVGSLMPLVGIEP